MFNKCILIPARGGSKGIPRKNMHNLLGKPLIHHALKAALASKINEVWVSTDNDEISEYCHSVGAAILDRPDNISNDLSTDLEVFRHFIESVGEKFDYIVHVRATFPKISSDIIDFACEEFEREYSRIDSLRSVLPVSENPYKMWHVNADGFLETVVKDNTLHSSPRQLIRDAYMQNACIDIIKTCTIVEKSSMIGDRCYPLFMEKGFNFDIDTVEDIIGKDW
jgi:CMP-N-acetylneuraminic acid synthetase